MDPLVTETFLQVARLHPHRIAVDVPPSALRPHREVLSYAELATRALQLSATLRSRVEADDRVALMFDRAALDLYVAQLGVLLAGAAFLSLDPKHPEDRNRRILEDAAPRLVLTEDAHTPFLERVVGPDRVCTLASAPADLVAHDPPAPGPLDLAYVIYTSGTTGQPKGVQIEHHSLANLVQSDIERFRLPPGTRVAQCSSPIYDSSIEETWLALATGGTLVPIDEATLRSGPDLLAWLRDEHIEMFCPAPTVLRSTGCTDPSREVPALRWLYVGGEALTDDLVTMWGRDLWLENGYGPTECTVTVVRGRMVPGQPVTIGSPLRGHRAHILGADLREVPDGEMGELFLSGPGLARGYLGRPGLTAERFPVHPEFGRIYGTGDLAIRRGDVLSCLGRADQQVKIRGHRIELEEVDAALARVRGVREGASFVQSGPGGVRLAAWVVPLETAAELDLSALRRELGAMLPAPMVPALIGVCGSLPRTPGGKRDRRALVPIVVEVVPPESEDAEPMDAIDEAVLSAFAAELGCAPSSRHAHFFHELGGDSLRAAMVVTRLRRTRATAEVTVRDVYETATAAGLAARLRTRASPSPAPSSLLGTRSQPRSVLAVGAAQTLGIALGFLALGWLSNLAFDILPEAIDELPIWLWLLCLPWLTLGMRLVWLPIALGLTMVAKRVLIGQYVPGGHPAWGSFHLRHWIVTRLAAAIPWSLVNGTALHSAVLRALGARVGHGVHIHRGVDLSGGGWDLLDLGDSVTLSQDASLRPVDLADRQFVLGNVHIGGGATLDVRAGMGPGSSLGANAWLGPLAAMEGGSSIEDGVRCDGVPARPTGRAPAIVEPSVGRTMSGSLHAVVLFLTTGMIDFLLGLPGVALVVAALRCSSIESSSIERWIRHPSWSVTVLLTVAAVSAARLGAWLLGAAFVSRALSPRVPSTVRVRSWPWIRLWCASGLLERAGDWLSGTLAWPLWLRAAGMKVGPDCEISTIVDVVPGMVTIGSGSFFADGIYLGGPQIQRGLAKVAGTRVGCGTFLGNHAVLPPGTTLPDHVLVGIATPVDSGKMGREGSSWFGNPAFDLPRREVVTMDRRQTHEPGPRLYLTRLAFELARFALPGLIAWTSMLWLIWGQRAGGGVLGWSASSLGVFLLLVGGVVFAKWCLLGRVRPGQHGLWSLWCDRWDLLYMLWGKLARPLLAGVEQTPWLPAYLRLMGASIGRRALLGRGFAQLVDPDMLTLGEDATFSGLLQAHSFEDRVLKIDRVLVESGATVGSDAVLLYGSRVGASAHVLAHSVVMKHESLLPGRVHQGCPTAAL